MHSAHHTPTLTIVATPAHHLLADVVAVGVFDGEGLQGMAGVTADLERELARARERGEFKSEPYELLWAVGGSGWASQRVLLVGLGKRSDCGADRVRRVGTTIGLAARQRRASTLALVMPESTAATPSAVQALAEGLVLANFDGASYKTKGPAPLWLDTVAVQTETADATLVNALERGRVMGECTNIARTLSNEPGNSLTPRVFAERAEAIGRDAGLKVEILDEVRMAELGMGMLLGVARGSAEPPRLIVLRYEPSATGAAGEALGLVGKGITFDTGGISIKPADKMERMKDDMSGGAAVLGAMTAIARLGAPVRCIGLIAAAENMPGGKALKPGDIVTSAEGKTVEVTNTDAEGRLVLGDALWYARQIGATRLVDIATLTGGCVVALGPTTAGLFGSPVAWRDDVQRASERAGDRAWPLPDFEDFLDQLKSDIADLGNSGTRWGSASVGAVFVKEFTGGLPWVHLDIAGPAWVEESKPYQVKGATGAGVRTLAELAFGAATWSKL